MVVSDKRLTPEEAGERLGVSGRTVKRWVIDGKIEGYRPGLAYQIPASAVEELLEKSRVAIEGSDE